MAGLVDDKTGKGERRKDAGLEFPALFLRKLFPLEPI